MKLKTLATLLVIFAVYTAAPAQKQPPAKLHHSATIKAQVGVPDGWEVDDPRKLQSGVQGLYLLSPEVNTEYRSNMVVVSVDVKDPDITMDEVAKSTMPPKAPPGFENYVVESSQKTTIDGRTAYRCVATATVKGTDIRLVTTLTLKKGILYVLTYTALKSSPGVNDPALKTILAGFKID